MRKLTFPFFAFIGCLMLFAALACGRLLVTSSASNDNAFVVASDQPMNGNTDANIMKNSRTPVIVELFTSEGCSSCPPADDLLARLATAQSVGGAEVIALGMHVDYWNRLGWNDAFSSPQWSGRQSEYARAFGNDGVYTPQMIVDGKDNFPGGNADKARAAIAEAARQPKAHIELAHTAKTVTAQELKIAIADLPANEAADVLLAITESNLRTNVTRGENANRRLLHAPVVRSLENIGSINNQKSFTATRTINFNADWKLQNTRAVVFIQSPTTHRILGAATVTFANK